MKDDRLKPFKVGVLGAGGRMGREICRAVAADGELDLVAAVDPRFAGIDLHQVAGQGVPAIDVAPDLDALAMASVDVAIDFSLPDATEQAMPWCAEHGVHMVIGTTGIEDARMDEARKLFGRKSGPNCIVASNFAVGAVLMARFVEMAARFMDGGEVIEIHHDGKVDAPSGTSLVLMEAIASGAEARSGEGGGAAFGRDATERYVLEGTRGGVGRSGVRVHSLRIPGMVAHHEAVFGAVGQALTIRHDAFDRTSFLPGVLLAVKAVASTPGLTLGLESILGL